MVTLIFNTPPAEFETIKQGKKNFILAKFKVIPVPGQRIILQTPDEEIDTVITDVHSEPGLMKGWLIVSFPSTAIEKVPQMIHFD